MNYRNLMVAGLIAAAMVHFVNRVANAYSAEPTCITGIECVGQ